MRKIAARRGSSDGPLPSRSRSRVARCAIFVQAVNSIAPFSTKSRRCGEAVQQSFEHELQQHDLDVLAAFASNVAQAGLYGRSEVLRLSGHTMASR